MKVLIVRLSAFGDIIHCLPALDDLLHHPEISEVHWLVDQRYRFVCDIFPNQVKIHTVALRGKQPLRSTWRTIRELRSIRFDAVFDLQGLIKSAALARACGSPVYGIDSSHLREQSSRILTHNVCFHSLEKHVVQQYRRVATAPFTDWKHAPDSAMTYKSPYIDIEQSSCAPDTKLLARIGLSDRRFVILHNAGGWETKQLPEHTWREIALGLQESGILPVFSWGNSDEQKIAQRLAYRSNGFALPERLNMSALCSLLTAARAVVGPDTGLLHLAAALGRPTVTFWGPSASWRSAPLNKQGAGEQGEQNWHIESNPACGPCFKRKCDKFVCMDAIQPELIIRILHEL
jgi:heptosyltransferase-1